ncbi:hypothetical protein GcM1_211050 [Golovinomyces cichoracearum]|uniref:Uncharacterized protein n=1 Tax=Golovinomyces cichoracearum TaxID=62708 RepID=A0A420IVC3_9PEZI|nr:hypothetical protein GcM1_211050 [Golovinomyces cichoracearum]
MPSFEEKKMAEMIGKKDDAMEFNLREAVRQCSAWASFSIPLVVAPVQGAFLTLDGMKQDPAGRKKGAKIPMQRKTFFSECQYINSALRKPGFIENTDLSKKIRNWLDGHAEKYDQMIASMARRKSAIVVEYLQDRESYAAVSMKQSFTCGCVQDNSVILDTATTNHELNNPIEVRTSNSKCFFQGFGSVRLAIKTDKGPGSIRIDDFQHIPGFHIKIVAYKAFKKGGAYLDGRNNWIRKIKDNSCVSICESSPFHLTKHADGVIIKDLEKRTTRDESPLCELQYAGDRPFQWVHIYLIHEEP